LRFWRVLVKGVPVPDESVEPTAAVVAPPTDEGQLPPTGEPAAIAPGEAAVSDAQGAASATPAFDLSTEEGWLEAAAYYEAGRKVLDKRQNDGFQNGRQNRDAELRRDQGTLSRATETAQWAYQQAMNGVPIEEIAKAIVPHVSANEGAVVLQTAKNLLLLAQASGDETAGGLLESLEGKPEELVTAAEVAYNSGIKKARSEGDAAGYARGLAEAEARLAAEKAAEAKEAALAGLSNPPTAYGQPPGQSARDLDGERLLNGGVPMNDPARKRVAERLGVPLPY